MLTYWYYAQHAQYTQCIIKIRRLRIRNYFRCLVRLISEDNPALGAGSRRFKSSRPDQIKQYVTEVRFLPGLFCLRGLLAVFSFLWPSKTNTLINAKSANYPPQFISVFIRILNNLKRVSMKWSGNHLFVYSFISEKLIISSIISYQSTAKHNL